MVVQFCVKILWLYAGKFYANISDFFIERSKDVGVFIFSVQEDKSDDFGPQFLFIFDKFIDGS